MLRRELRHDVIAQTRERGGISGILITGDIAASGQLAEYAKAEDWLAELCGQLGIGSENVWVIPGNHDADWSAHSPTHDAFRRELELIDLLQLDNRLEEILKDSDAATVLLQPLSHFRGFARKYGSDSDLGVPYWSRDFALTDNFVLRIRGLNSVLISDSKDASNKPRLVIGSAQASLARERGTVHLAMCHHPPDWFRDASALDQIHANATVLLTGHSHRSEIRRVQRCLCVAAGALHPERDREGWEPRYNIITIRLLADMIADPPVGQVEVSIYPRTWDGAARFMAGIPDHGRECHLVDLDEVAAEALRPIGAEEERYEAQPRDTEVEHLADRRERLRHRFGELLAGARNVIARTMGFSLGEIQDIGPAQLADAVMARAQADDRLSELWDLVEAGHFQKGRDNPYRERGDA